MIKILSRVAAVLTLAAAASAQAAPIKVTFTGTVGTVDASLSSLVASGETVLIDVILDNGGTSTLSQSWSIADTVSATVRAGSYLATWTNDFFTGADGFTTDAVGKLVVANWLGTVESPTSEDSLGTGARLFAISVRASNGDFFIYSPSLLSLAAWSDPVRVNESAPVPLPATLLLMLLGLAALSASRTGNLKGCSLRPSGRVTTV
jgi:hypothetical protein